MSFTPEQKTQYELALEAATITTMNGALAARGVKAIYVRIALFAWLLPLLIVAATYAAVVYSSWVITVCGALIYIGWVVTPLSCMLALSVASEVYVKRLADMLYEDFQKRQADAAE